MPYKYHADKRAADRRYVQNRIKEANKPAVDLERKITRMVLLRPGKYDALALYVVLRKQYVKLSAIRQVIDDLCAGGLFCWAHQRLELTNRAKELFGPPARRPEEDRADDPTEG